MKNEKSNINTMACLDFFKNSGINAYNPNCNPEFLLCIKHVSTDTTTSTIGSSQTKRPSMFQHVKSKFINSLLKTHVIEGGAWVVGMAFPVDSQ